MSGLAGYSPGPNARGANAAAFTALVLIAQQVAGKATRDALFLTSFHVTSLPFAMAGGAVLSLVAVLWLSRLMSRHSPRKLLPILFAGSMAAFTAEWLLHGVSPPAAAVAVYLHTALLGPALLTTFWSLVNERFDPHTAKRAVSWIAGGGTLGGVVGGLTAWRASTLVSLPTLLLWLSAMSALGVVGALVSRGGSDASKGGTTKAEEAIHVSGLNELRSAPFLRNLAILVSVGAMTSTLLDYVFSAQVTAAFGKGTPLLSFFSLFWLAVGVLSFLLQIALGRLALEKLGLAVSIAFLPGIIILGGAFGMAVPGLVSGMLLRGAEAVQRNTLFRAAYELLYTPLSEERKRATKAFIDIGFDRLGTVVGSGIVLVTLRFTPHATSVMLAVVVALALATLPLARMLHVGYVEALERSLKEGAEKLELTASEGMVPAGELQHREELVQQVEALRPGGLTALLQANEDSLPAEDEGAAPPSDSLRAPDAILASAVDLLSATPHRVERALGKLSPRGPDVACAILLLAQSDLSPRLLASLRELAPSITGQLIDALLDPTFLYRIRRRIPRVLAACVTQRAADGLMLGMADERFEVRYQCGRALLKVTDAGPDIVVAREQVLQAVQRELAHGKLALDAVTHEDDADDDLVNPLMETLVRDRVARSLEHVFTILSLHLEREPLRMAFRALHHDDARHRGTALEYLDVTLPPDVREALWPFLGAEAPLPTNRPAENILADLAATARRPSKAPPGG